MSVKCIIPGQEEFVSSHVTHMPHAALHYLSNVLEPGEKQDNHGTALSTHPMVSSTRQQGLPKVPHQCHLFTLHSSEMTCARWHLGRGEERVRSQDCWNSEQVLHSCLGYCRTWLFFPAQVISFSIRKKKVGAATSRKYKQETHLKLREGDSNLT